MRDKIPPPPPFFVKVNSCFFVSSTQYYHGSLKGVLRHLMLFTFLNPFIKLNAVEHEADI